MSKYTTFKVGNPELGLKMYKSENFDKSINDFTSEPIPIKSTPAPFSFPLSSEIWGKRTKGEDGKPNGGIEVGVWGEKSEDGFEVIKTQYHPSFKSFDYHYQVAVKMNLKQTDLDNLFIELGLGVNAFETSSNLSNFLLNYCSYNGSNEGRNPTKRVLYEAHDISKEVESDLSDAEEFVDAMQMVFSLKGDDAKAQAYASVFGLPKTMDTMSIIKKLTDKIKDDTKGFLAIIEKHRLGVRALLNSALSNKVARFTKDGDFELLNIANDYEIVGNVKGYKSVEKAIKELSQYPFESSNVSIIKGVKVAVDRYNKK